jgi:hypothetical protein
METLYAIKWLHIIMQLFGRMTSTPIFNAMRPTA